jgi:predicted GIY-YIG superfamily endonuclease
MKLKEKDDIVKIIQYSKKNEPIKVEKILNEIMKKKVRNLIKSKQREISQSYSDE